MPVMRVLENRDDGEWQENSVHSPLYAHTGLISDGPKSDVFTERGWAFPLASKNCWASLWLLESASQDHQTTHSSVTWGPSTPSSGISLSFSVEFWPFFLNVLLPLYPLPGHYKTCLWLYEPEREVLASSTTTCGSIYHKSSRSLRYQFRFVCGILNNSRKSKTFRLSASVPSHCHHAGDIITVPSCLCFLNQSELLPLGWLTTNDWVHVSRHS